MRSSEDCRAKASREPVDYRRPQPERRHTGRERDELLRRYYAEYSEIAAATPELLNKKVPKDAFNRLLGRVGVALLTESAELARLPGPVRTFLEENPLPPSIDGKLPPEFRAFCLALNALKQWVAAEQAATDRYLLGGTARAACRAAADTCVVSGVALDRERLDLHHPVRDGRPPIPLDREAHARLEGQIRRDRAKRVVGSETHASPRTSALTIDGVATYRASTLSFKARIIEPLEEDESFRIVTPKGAYLMTKREFYENFPNVAASHSYRVQGTYGYSRVPLKAHRFITGTTALEPG